RQNFDLRDGHCQSASPFANIRQLPSYLILEVPRKNQDIVRLCFTDPRWFEDWNMSAREKLAMFVGIAVYRVVEKIGPDPAVIEKGVPFPGRAVAYNGFPFPFRSNQEAQDPALCLFHLFGKRGVGLETCETRLNLARRKLLNAACYGLNGILWMTRIDSQRTAMRGQLFDVEYCEAKFGKDLRNGNE